MAALTADQPSTVLTIGNERGVPAGYEIEALGWEQTPAGEVLLPSTTGIRVEPASLDIPANGTAQLRVTALDRPGTTEKVYRIRVRERADRQREQGEEDVQVLAVITVPVFLAPSQAEVKARRSAPSAPRSPALYGRRLGRRRSGCRAGRRRSVRSIAEHAQRAIRLDDDGPATD